ncbi:hypothetical protein EYF80_033300 [Liparis tanakae]|uniref:Uncharacterized protein n=1 Tax=Liparis tanakae TaxID=230148 RepID=A0A4Z2GUS2_9TELE|nr:hypothetical protein EYF80_033300 [Liparis tanakae]
MEEEEESPKVPRLKRKSREYMPMEDDEWWKHRPLTSIIQKSICSKKNQIREYNETKRTF